MMASESQNTLQDNGRTIIDSSNSSSPSSLPSTYTLRITLVRAKTLRSADLIGTSDPYAKLFYTEPNARGMESAAGTDGTLSRKEGITRSIGDFGRGMLHQSMRVVGGTIDAVNTVGGAIGTAARASMDVLRIHPGTYLSLNFPESQYLNDTLTSVLQSSLLVFRKQQLVRMKSSMCCRAHPAIFGLIKSPHFFFFLADKEITIFGAS